MKKFTFTTKVILLLLSGILSASIINAQHFSPPTSNNGTGQWQMYAGGVTLDGQNMVAGDEIGVFDGATCVGSFVLIQVCTENNMTQNEFYAYEENGAGTTGYTAGNAYTFKLWDNSANTEYTNVSISFVPGGQYTDPSNFPPANQYRWSLMKFAFLTNSGHSVSGTITDENNDGYEGATVSITDQVTTWTTTTDASGDYTLQGIADNANLDYTLEITNVPGYNEVSDGPFAVTTDITGKDYQLSIEDGTFKGYVRDNSSNIVAGATVSVNTTPATTATTDANGYYTVSVTPGTYTLTASKVNYSDDVQADLTITSGQDYFKDFVLGEMPGSIDGYVKFTDNGTDIGANGITVSVDGTILSDLTENDGSGDPGYFKILNVPVGYHSITVSGGAITSQTVNNIQVTSNTTETVDDIMITLNSYYNFTPGDPSEPVWTVYLKSVGDATNSYDLKAGDEIAIYKYHPTTPVLVGVYQAKGEIDGGVGTELDNPLLAFSKLSDGSTGYTSNDVFRIDVHIAGGTTTTLTNNATFQTWTADNVGDAFDYDPSTVANGYKFPTGEFIYSIVELDFQAANGDFVVNLKDENNDDLLATDNVSLSLDDGTNPPTTKTGTGSTHTFTSVAPGTYTLTISGNQFQTKTVENIVIGYAQNLEKTYQISHAASETQTISLHAGINIVSRRVGVEQDDMLDFFDNDFKDNSLSVVSNEEAHVLQKVVGTGWTPTDYKWDIDRGYKMVMNGADDIIITDVPMSYNSPITVHTSSLGYNIVAYYPVYSLDAEAAFADIKDETKLSYVRQWDGKMLRYISALSKWDNQIGNTQPGQGYIVKWVGASDGTITYPPEPPMMNSQEVVNDELEHFDFPGGNPFTSIFTFYLQGNDLAIGDEVAAFDGDKMVGAVKVTSLESQTSTSLNMFRGLETDDDGYTPGHPISLLIWKRADNKVFWLKFTILNEDQQEGDQYAYAGEGFPTGDYKYSLVEISMPLAVTEVMKDNINLYPNPANNMLNISAPFEIDNIVIVNILGQQVLNTDATKGITELNVSNLDSGIYFVNIIIDGQKITKKLTIQ